ncbi:two-component system sensor histidine kinase QseC [Paraburkholderia sp. BL6669N2]|uniref:ATP-binding protein n=1 Tax=Paraburkholderia sp. BL6669N2 TaxID=1938807 RepID=UPI000E22B6E6|nr:ATP-binding protein [Paraburkholderia sp. BL6669N2]REG52208.1 two-component system sensor histidine kinase QseC [Paraburkholderia sp. BL6669N2]
MIPSSIRRRLTLLVFIVIPFVWGAAGWSSYRQATREVSKWENARIAELAQIVVLLDEPSLVSLANASIDWRDEERAGIANAGNDDGDDALPRDALFQVRDSTNRVLAGSPQLNVLHAWDLPVPVTSGSQDILLRGRPWRTYTLRDTARGKTVRVFEPANTKSGLVSGIARQITWPIVIAMPFLTLFVWIVVSFSLRPLRTLSDAIRYRHIHRMDPINIGRTPTEVRPLVDAINDMQARLQDSFARARAFTADAAHELKTPLTAIKVQAQVALATPDRALQRLAMQHVLQGVDRSTRLTEQLLLLARLDEHEKIKVMRISLAKIASDAIAAKEQHARQKRMSVAFDGEAKAEILAEPELTKILVDNLLDNAVKYGVTGGRIEVLVELDEAGVRLVVRDDGPGVDAADFVHLTSRFFRVIGNQASGSGLGLSIVSRIADHFDANLSFGRGIGNRGFGVYLAFRSERIAEPCPRSCQVIAGPAISRRSFTNSCMPRKNRSHPHASCPAPAGVAIVTGNPPPAEDNSQHLFKRR